MIRYRWGAADEDHPLRLWRAEDLDRAARLPTGAPGGDSLYDAATGQGFGDVDLGAEVFDAVTAAPDSVVVVTGRGITGFEVDPF